jgi:hypothetical protein
MTCLQRPAVAKVRSLVRAHDCASQSTAGARALGLHSAWQAMARGHAVFATCRSRHIRCTPNIQAEAPLTPTRAPVMCSGSQSRASAGSAPKSRRQLSPIRAGPAPLTAGCGPLFCLRLTRTRRASPERTDGVPNRRRWAPPRLTQNGVICLLQADSGRSMQRMGVLLPDAVSGLPGRAYGHLGSTRWS